MCAVHWSVLTEYETSADKLKKNTYTVNVYDVFHTKFSANAFFSYGLRMGTRRLLPCRRNIESLLKYINGARGAYILHRRLRISTHLGVNIRRLEHPSKCDGRWEIKPKI